MKLTDEEAEALLVRLDGVALNKERNERMRFAVSGEMEVACDEPNGA